MTPKTNSRLRQISVWLLAACFALSASLASACGKERWSVKTVTDKDAARVQEAPTPSTINQLQQIAAPINPNLRPDSRYSPTELTTYEVTGYITLIKAEADQDYHIKGPINKPIKTRRLVTVTGIGFFDHIHGQTGVAPHGIELHPMLQVVLHDHKSIQDFKKANRAKRAEQ